MDGSQRTWLKIWNMILGKYKDGVTFGYIVYCVEHDEDNMESLCKDNGCLYSKEFFIVDNFTMGYVVPELLNRLDRKYHKGAMRNVV